MKNSRPLFLAACALMLALPASATTLKSGQVKEGAPLALEQVSNTCGGGGVSPALNWSAAPAQTKSYAVTLFDPDGAGGRGFWHWAMFDIPSQTSALPPNAGSSGGANAPQGALQATNSHGSVGYAGACPPPGSGMHHYIFTVWALDTAKLGLPADAPIGQVVPALQAHVLSRATITARYGR